MLACALALVAVAGICGAATSVPAGTLSADATWNATGSPYTLSGTVTVAAGVHLQIAAGASVEAPQGAALVVNGELDALGTAASPIAFRPAGNNASWAGIQVAGSGRARVENATLDAPQVGVRASGGGALTLSNVTVRKPLDTGVFLDSGAAAATLTDLSIANGTIGLRVGPVAAGPTIRGLTVDGAGTCVRFEGSTNVSLRNAALAHCSSFGARLSNDRNTTADNVSIDTSDLGINTTGSNGLRLSRVSISSLHACLYVTGGVGNRFTAVQALSCDVTLLVLGGSADLLVDGLNASFGGRVVLFNATNTTVQNSFLAGAAADAFTNRWEARRFPGEICLPPLPDPPPPIDPPCYGPIHDVLVHNVTATGQDWGAVFVASYNISFHNTTLTPALGQAFWFLDSNNISLVGSKIIGVGESLLAGNVTGLWVEASTIISTAGYGVRCVICVNPTFLGNTITGNQIGLNLDGGTGGLVARNLFLFNNDHASTNTAAHAWDDGAVGNLWDDYDGIDANLDGIGDTPYIVSGAWGVDRYPIARFADSIDPVADAGPDFVVFEDQPVWFNGWRCTDNIAIRLYLWSSTTPPEEFTVEGYDATTTFEAPGIYEVTLTVVDWGGNSAQDTVNVFVLDRTPPVAHAGGNRTVDEDVPVVFDGSASTDNDPAFPGSGIFEWKVADVSGSRTVYGLLATYTFLEPGNFTVRLTVRDARGITSEDRFYVVVRDRTPPALGPLAAPVGVEDHEFRAYAALSTDNDPAWPVGKVEWFELRRGDLQLDNATESPAVFNVSEPGLYSYWYFVHDAVGNLASAHVEFFLGDVTPPDLSALVNLTGELGDAVAFDLTGVTDNDPAFPATLHASWEIPVQSGRTILEGGAVNFTFVRDGRFMVWVEVADASLNTARKPIFVTIVDTTAPALDLFGPMEVEAGVEARFWADAEDASGVGPLWWNVTGLEAGRAGPVFAYRFPGVGAYTVRVRVEDALGHGTETSMEVHVADSTAPRIELSCAPRGPCTGVTLVRGTALAAALVGDDAREGTAVAWSWGDGAVTDGLIASHAYGEAGNFTVRVVAEDENGNTNESTFVVEVIAPAEPLHPPPATNTTTTETAAGGLPPVTAIAFVLLAAPAGAFVGFMAGRSRRGASRP